MVIATVLEIANDDLILTDIVKKQRLHSIDVFNTKALQFGSENVQEMTMQTLDKTDDIEIWLAHGADDIDAPQSTQ